MLARRASLVLEIQQIYISATKFMLTRDKGVDLILKLAARWFDVGLLPVVD
jgi:hypothetical protein